MGNGSEVVRIIPKLDMAVNHWKMIVLATSDVTTVAQCEFRSKCSACDFSPVKPRVSLVQFSHIQICFPPTDQLRLIRARGANPNAGKLDQP